MKLFYAFSRRATGSGLAKAVLLTILVCLFVASPSFAQNTIEVKGRVYSEDMPLIGAGVAIKGTTTGVATDRDGNFTLKVPFDAILVVSSLGYKTMEVPVGGRTFIEINVEIDSELLDDVIVVGYGAQKKVNLTGAVATVPTDQFTSRPIANAVEAMQGSVPGLIIRQGDSTPGSSPSINIRGYNTLNNNDPLIIIDGVEGSLANLNPADIDQISVLKDASSTAIYGSRASNGVILVTTKKGENGKVNINYDFSYGFQQPTGLPHVVDSWQYAEIYNEAAINSGLSTKFTAEDIAYYKNGGTNCKWINEIYKDYAPVSSHNLSVTGGNDKITYLASLGFLNERSMFVGPNYGYDRYNGRLNLTHKMFKGFLVTLNAQFARNDIKSHAYWTDWIIEQPCRMPPIYEIMNEDGTYNYPSGSNSNSLQRLMDGGYTRDVNDELLGSIKAEWEIIDGLKLTGTAGGRIWNNRSHMNRQALEGTGSGDKENLLSENFYRSQNITANLLLSYDKSIRKHTFGILAGFSYEGFSESSFYTNRLTDDGKYDIFVGSLNGDDVSNSGSASDWSIYSGIARVTYNFDERYLFEFNIRNDYSSYFAKGNRSGIFPSFSAGWRISQEHFWSALRQWIPSLKIRASWGLVGNNRIGAYRYMQTVSVTNGISFGDSVASTAYFSSANSDLKWETTRMADVGIDIGLLKNSLNITFDYYDNMTRDILVSLPVPAVFGNGSPIQNYGKVETNGWEVAVNYDLVTGPVSHHFTANVSDSYNKVVDVNGEETINGSDVVTIIKEGYPINSYYTFKSDGFFQNEKEVAAGPHLDGIIPKPGDIRYVDKNGDGLITEAEDRFVVGNDFPRYLFSFLYGFEVKGFDFSMMWQGVGKRSRWMRGESVEAFHNSNEGPVLEMHLDRWTPANPNASYPRVTMGSESNNNATKSDFWIFDAKYLRLKNVQAGYTFPSKWTNKIHIETLRIYVSLQNALTFSAMPSGWDPEYNADGSGRAYPLARVYSFGLNVKF